MTDAELRDAAFAVLREIAPEADLPALDPNADLREALDLDSMDFLHFMVGLHEATGVDVPESDYARLSTLAGCVAYLAAHTRAARA
ncbi:MAG TPA: acyl carrier protein [Myxococcota bacterium]|nr:acyl carrier protein [Myxococcota bacterium]